MRRHWPGCAILPVIVVGVLDVQARSGEPAGLPREIVLTPADVRDISTKGELRGRPLISRFPMSTDKGLVWRGERVFLGTKRDVIAWLRSVPHGGANRLNLHGVREAATERGFHYALLCDALLDSGDPDIARAVLWNYAGRRWGYLDPRWEAIWRDRSLPVADRIVAWRRRHTGEPDRQTIAAFWAELGDAMRPDDVIELVVDSGRAGLFPHEVIHPRHVPWHRVAKALEPFVRREYVHVHCPEGTPYSRYFLSFIATLAFRYPGQAAFARKVIDLIAECDGADIHYAGNALWEPLDPAAVDDGSARVIRRLALSAQIPETAGRAFSTYLATPSGKKELARDHGKALVQRYLQVAFSGFGTVHKKRNRLAALAQAEADAWARAARLVDTRDGRNRLMRILRDGKVDITVTQQQFTLLRKAWREYPKALEYLIVEGKE